MRLPAFPTLSVIVLASTSLLAACSYVEQPIAVRGNRVDDALLKELVPGTSTRGDATALLGSPTAHASFDDNVWLYIGSLTRPVVAGTNAVVTQDVVQLTFDQAGVLRDVRHLGDDDRLPVDVVERTTPSPGSSASILQQLFGSVGQFSTGALPSADQNSAPSGGVPSPH